MLECEKCHATIRVDECRNMVGNDLCLHCFADALEAENKRLGDLLASPEKITMDMVAGETKVEVKHWAVRLIVQSLGETFDELGGVNFVTMDCGPDSKDRQFVLTIRRKNGATVEEKHKEVRQQRDEAVNALYNAVTTLGIIKLPQEDDTVASNVELIDVLEKGLQAAIVRAGG